MTDNGSTVVVRVLAKSTLLVLSLLGLSVGASAQTPSPQPLDGLHGTEKARALRSLGRSHGVDKAVVRAQQSSAAAAAVPTEPVLLLLELRREKGSVERLADAWYYSYPRNETIHKIVDLASGEVRSEEVVIDLQLPLVDAEISRAFDIVLTSAAHNKALQTAYLQVTGARFLDRSQVSYKAFVFHPDTVQEGLEPTARRCGLHRCAQMLLYTHDNIALDMSPVVDLSTSRVLQNLELRARAIVRRKGIVR